MDWEEMELTGYQMRRRFLLLAPRLTPPFLANPRWNALVPPRNETRARERRMLSAGRALVGRRRRKGGGASGSAPLPTCVLACGAQVLSHGPWKMAMCG